MAIRYVDIAPEDGKAPKAPKPAAKTLAAEPETAAEAPSDSPPAGKPKRRRK